MPKLTPSWVPFPSLLGFLVATILGIAAIRLLWARSTNTAVKMAGGTLLLLTVFLYLPILMLEFGTSQTLEGLNYVSDTLLAAAAVLLCGLGGYGLKPATTSYNTESIRHLNLSEGVGHEHTQTI